MPERIKYASSRLMYRLLYAIILATVAGISANFVVDFLYWRLSNAEIALFSWDRLTEYVLGLYEILLEPRRVIVIAYATAFCACMHAMPIYYLRFWVIARIDQKLGIRKGTNTLTWSTYFKTLPLRMVYWVVSLILDKAALAWLGYVMYVAWNPNEHVSKLKLMQNVWAPWFHVTNPDNYPVLPLLLISIAIVLSMYHNVIRPVHESNGRKGGFIRPKEKS